MSCTSVCSALVLKFNEFFPALSENSQNSTFLWHCLPQWLHAPLKFLLLLFPNWHVTFSVPFHRYFSCCSGQCDSRSLYLCRSNKFFKQNVHKSSWNGHPWVLHSVAKLFSWPSPSLLVSNSILLFQKSCIMLHDTSLGLPQNNSNHVLCRHLGLCMRIRMFKGARDIFGLRVTIHWSSQRSQRS